MNASVVICKRVNHVEILYFNCLECGSPLRSNTSRASGHCGCISAAEPVRQKVEKRKYVERRKRVVSASEADLQRRIDQVVAAAEREEKRVVANVPSS